VEIVRIVSVALVAACMLGPPGTAAASSGTHFTSGAACPLNPLPPAFDDVAYMTSPVQATLDVWEPADGGVHPALVFAHGGGWHGLCKEEDQFTSNAQAIADAGFVVFAIDYRMACDPASPPGNVDPALCGYRATVPAQDVETAVEWVRTNGAVYGATAGPLGLFGTSAGGNLALQAAFTAQGLARPDAVAGWSGIPDLTMYQLSGDPARLYRVASNYVGQRCTHTCPASWANASPVNFASSDDPPAFIANGTGEISPLQAAQELQQNLEAAGVPVTMCIVATPDHAWGLQADACSTDPSTTVLDATLAWMHATLGA